MLRFLLKLTECVEELHARGKVWLSFGSDNTEEISPERLRIINIETGTFPVGTRPDELVYNSHFAAPEIVRNHAEDIGPRTDVFHLALFAYYWLAGLLPKGFPGEGLEAFWYQIPKLRIFAPWLPPGIARILAQGTAQDPALRFATPRALANALQAAVDRNRERVAFKGKITWSYAAETRTGRTKTALHKDNEDRVLVCPFPNNERALLAVADGISTCDVGSGALASLITAIVLENAFDALSTRETFAAKIAKVCREGADTLLAWAMEKGYGEQLQQGADLMGTTLTAAWLEGNLLSIANLGDSRAYLIDKTEVEQLTVDGDLASGMLADGMPPENIQDLGQIGKALRECVGGCTFNDAGEVIILDDCCRPTVNHWPMLPGDTVVLCSDGLVEDDAFLEPEALGEIVRAKRDMPAADLARHLAEVADNSHRLPSSQEPDGYGDNISCIVIKIEAATSP